MTACGARWCKAVPTSEVRNPGPQASRGFLIPLFQSSPGTRAGTSVRHAGWAGGAEVAEIEAGGGAAGGNA